MSKKRDSGFDNIDIQGIFKGYSNGYFVFHEHNLCICEEFICYSIVYDLIKGYNYTVTLIEKLDVK